MTMPVFQDRGCPKRGRGDDVQDAAGTTATAATTAATGAAITASNAAKLRAKFLTSVA